jgi:hypothetical protein
LMALVHSRCFSLLQEYGCIGLQTVQECDPSAMLRINPPKLNSTNAADPTKNMLERSVRHKTNRFE